MNMNGGIVIINLVACKLGVYSVSKDYTTQ